MITSEMTVPSALKLTTAELGLKIKTLRKERSITMRELALTSKVSASLISKIEAGIVSPTVMSLQKLLNAMNIDLQEFFANKTDLDPSDQFIFRRSSMSTKQDGERKCYYAFPRHPEIKTEVTYEEYLPYTKNSQAICHRHDVCGIVVSGELTLEILEKQTDKIRSGDAFYIKAGLYYITRNESDDILRLIFMQLIS
jgi:transcriptional regulator with XRE-family HTH domain